MKTLLKKILLVVGLGFAAVFTSCQGSSGPSTAVACPKYKTVWFNAGGKGTPTALKAAGAMDCPDCMNKASPMLKGLSMNNHTCKSCGGTMFHCR